MNILFLECKYYLLFVVLNAVSEDVIDLMITFSPFFSYLYYLRMKGGGFYIYDNANVALTSCTVSNNTASSNFSVSTSFFSNRIDPSLNGLISIELHHIVYSPSFLIFE